MTVFTHGFADLGDVRIHYVTAGDRGARPVVLLHGYPQTWFSWREVMTHLVSAGFRCVAPDLRGLGDSSRPFDGYDKKTLAGDVKRLVVDRLDVDSFAVVGHDWGGAVAWLVAAHYPQRIRTLTSVSMPHPAAFADALTGGDPDQVAKSGYIELLRNEGAAEEALLAGDGAGLRGVLTATGYPDEAAMGEYVRPLTQPGALTAALNWYRAVSMTGAAARAAGGAKIEAPTMYVWGDADPALGRVAAEGTAAFVKGPYRFEALPGVGHWIPEEVPEELNRLLLDHLSSHR